MAKSFKVNIITPEKTVFEAEAESVTLPGSQGYLGQLYECFDTTCGRRYIGTVYGWIGDIVGDRVTDYRTGAIALGGVNGKIVDLDDQNIVKNKLHEFSGGPG